MRRAVASRVLPACLAAPLAGMLSAQPPVPVRAEVQGIEIAKKAYAGDDNLWTGNPQGGISIAVLLTSEKPGLIDVDHDASSITVLSDDRGTDLRKKKEFGNPGGSLWPFSKVAKDGKACQIEIKSEAVPAPGAKSIRIEGEIALVFARGQEKLRQDEVKAQAGAEIKAGSLAMKIVKAGKPDWGDDPLAVDLQFDGDAAQVAGIRFLEAGGAEIPSRQQSSMRMNRVTSWTYNLKKAVPSFSVEVSVWKDMETVKTPLRLEVSVGF